jgi:hypothetical protein
MKITIENTSKVVTLQINGVEVPARIWEGVSEGGVPVMAYVTRITAPRNADCIEFERALKEVTAPSAEAAVIPLKMIL